MLLLMKSIEADKYAQVIWLDYCDKVKEIKMGFGLVLDGCLIKYNFPERDIFISDDVKVIGRMVFRGTDIMSVRIHQNVTEIHCQAFFACPNMKSVVIPDNVTLIEDMAFGYGYGGKMEDFCILGKKGSEAERYAKENGFTFYEVINFGF